MRNNILLLLLIRQSQNTSTLNIKSQDLETFWNEKCVSSNTC